MAVSQSGEYTVYIKDKVGNITTKTITVTIDNNDNNGNTKLPNTGAYFPVIAIIMLASISVICYKKYKKNKF
ncbi:MAG: LPXTG cell wall anchor domain-containing protein [Bacilli bacterium]|nr:LPXTG cell wall anchor domain-containing protein [Bacilli bacterium]